MFEKFPSLTRFSHGWTITEKLDGTNAAVVIVHESHEGIQRTPIEQEIARFGELVVFAQSRSKLITPGKSTDNHGFARFVQDNAEELVAKLGEGRHFGEWVGPGIGKRHYNLKEKQFALFNAMRWGTADLPERVTTVPELAHGYMENPGQQALISMKMLKDYGSSFGPRDSNNCGFGNPEGVVMYHAPSNTAFKKTFDYDEQGKWADKGK